LKANTTSAAAWEEIRLLSCDRRDTQAPFSLLLVGDEQLLPRLQMGINAPLLARLGFSLFLPSWSPADAHAYLQARLAEAGLHANPFDAAAVQLLLQAANGLPRLLNHLAQRALEAASGTQRKPRQGVDLISRGFRIFLHPGWRPRFIMITQATLS